MSDESTGAWMVRTGLDKALLEMSPRGLCEDCEGHGLRYTACEIYDHELGWVTDYHEDECPSCYGTGKAQV